MRQYASVNERPGSGERALADTRVLSLSHCRVLRFGAVQAQNRAEFHETYNLSPGGTVSVSNVSGYIRVSGWDENRVRVDAVKRPRRNDEELDKVQIQVSASPERVEIRTIYPQTRWSNLNISVDYDIKVPRSAILNSLTSVSGDVAISKVGARVVARSTSGNVTAKSIGGEATLSSVSGNVTATAISEILTATSTSGDLQITDVGAQVTARSTSGTVRASEIKGDVEASSTSGGVRLEHVGGRVRARSTSGAVYVGDVAGDVDATTTSDMVTIEKVRGRVTASAISGQIIAREVREGVRASSVSGSIEIHQTKGSISLDSTSGDITLLDVDSELVRAKSHSGAVRYQGRMSRNGRYDFDSFSGGIVVALPADTDFDLLARTSSGEIETDFPVQTGPNTNLSSSRRRLQATHGKGGAQLNLTGFSASIKVKKM